MLKSNLNYPYPMLKSKSIDYKTSIISSDVEIETNDNSYILKANITTNDENVNNLILEGSAKKGLLVKSNAVWFRRFYEVIDDPIIISSKDLYGKVDLIPCIVAAKKIERFFSDDFEDEFKNINISIEEGEFIGIGEELCFDAVLDSDILKNTSSIFELALSKEKEISFDLEEDKIVIYIPKEMHELYVNIEKSGVNPTSILNSMVVYPVLLSTLYIIKTLDDENEYSMKKWYITLKRTIESRSKSNELKGLNSFNEIDDPILLAQTLTNGLSMTSFMKLKDIVESCGD